MDPNTVAERFELALSGPVDALIDPDVRVRWPADRVSGWDLPAADRDALTGWGLPSPPDSSLPLTPDGADSRAPDGTTLYALATMFNLTIGAAAGDGRVLGVRDVTDRPAALGGAVPKVVYVNASVALFAECAWRVYQAGEVLVELDSPDLAADWLRRLWDTVRTLDPGTDRELSESLWKGQIQDW